ncbi:MAG: NAD-glutamate dehydrogenase, partial [Deltaproteobacteria bacterium]|nr:NAD-glutamate dehydrogenase [Deltaproteobacteria bacterium]
MDTSLEAQIEKELAAYKPSWRPDHRHQRDVFRNLVRAFVQGDEGRLLGQRGLPTLLPELEKALRFMAIRPAGKILVRVFNPDAVPGSPALDRTIIETCMRDQPFIVDTIRLYLRAAGLRERFLTHPILAVRRDKEGRIEELGDNLEGGRSDSFVHAEIDAVPRERHGTIAADIEDLLRLAMSVVGDFSEMIKEVRNAVKELEHYASTSPVRNEQAREASQFMDWLTQENFVFLGYRSYSVSDPGGDLEIVLRKGTGLGIGRDEKRSRYVAALRGTAVSPTVRMNVLSDELILIDKANADSPVHRSGKIDHITVKQFSRDGELCGLGAYFGLFTHRALEEPGSEVPILRTKLPRVLALERAVAGTHHFKEVSAAFDSMPLEYLFLASPAEIQDTIRLIIAAQARNEIGLHLSREPSGRSLLVMLVLPAGKYGEELREEVERYLAENALATYSDHRVAFTEMEAAVVHFYFTSGTGAIPELDHAAILEKVRSLAQSWGDRLLEALTERHGVVAAARIFRRYAEAFPESYEVSSTAAMAAEDIDRIEELLKSGDLQVSLNRHAKEGKAAALHLSMYAMERVTLADSMPALGNLGLRVVSEVPTDVRPA